MFAKDRLHVSILTTPFVLEDSIGLCASLLCLRGGR